MSLIVIARQKQDIGAHKEFTVKHTLALANHIFLREICNDILEETEDTCVPPCHLWKTESAWLPGDRPRERSNHSGRNAGFDPAPKEVKNMPNMPKTIL